MTKKRQASKPPTRTDDVQKAFHTPFGFFSQKELDKLDSLAKKKAASQARSRRR